MNDPRLRRLAVVGLLAAALIGLGVVAPEVYSGTFSDMGTFARVMALVVALIAFALAVRRFVRPPAFANLVASVPIVVVATLVVWPYVRPATEVDEALPPVVTTTTAATPVVESAATAAPVPTTPASTTAVPTTSTSAPAGPLELRRSEFQGLAGHRGSGDAVLYDLGEGPTLLRFEEVDIGSGPDLEVFVVPGSDRRGLADAVHVASLTAERGNQNYTVPDGVDLTGGPWTVLVWCETFDVEVANATFSA